MRSLAALVLLAGASVGLTAMPERSIFDDDPPRRRRQPIQTHVTLPAAEPEVLSKRAKRRQRGKARETARLERAKWHLPAGSRIIG